ncbi:MAG: cytochrome c biogenesis protein ResB [Planctomycetes bacterium]|nr:cytochrome c biogenesis protein ResB [Planctomycetota bacterium]
MRVIEAAASKRLAVVLIAALAAACLLGGVSDTLFSPWVMAALLAALAINTAACTTRMMRSTRGNGGADLAMEGTLPPDKAGSARERARELLRALGYRVRTIGPVVEGRRGVSARWMLILFHAALVALLAGVGAEVLVRSERVLILAPGAFFEDRPESYAHARDGAFGGTYARFYGRAVRVWRKDGVDWCELRVVHRGRGGKERLRFSRSAPARLLGGTVRLRQTGRAPVLVLRKGDRILLDACVNVFGRDEVPLAGGGKLQLVPEADDDTFTAMLAEEGRTVLSGSVRPGARLEGGGTSLEMPEVRRWAEIALVEDPALEPVLVSAALCVVSLAAYALMHGRSMAIWIGPDGAVRVSGRTHRFNPLFQEEMAGVLEGLVS